LGLVSDYPARGKLETLEIDHLFDTVVTAQDPSVGAFKPSPRGIEAALDRLGARSADSLYVGDRVDVDYPAALAANVDCALFISNPPKPAPFICLESCSHLQRLLLP
jgi:phosphoglycolate phosphatase-like HAD superfamily hydrolase